MPKITDFDCICKTNVNLSQRVSFKKIQGSPAYYSPEMLRQSELNLHDDVWSLGIIMY
jgi:serine/threonine protein kinase